MEIKEQADNLTIEANVSEEVGGFVLSILKYIYILPFLVLGLMRESMVGAIVLGILGPVAIWFIASLFIGIDAAFRCVLEKDLQLATVTFRAPWHFWIPRVIKFPLGEVTAVIFSKDENDEPKLFFKKKTGDMIPFAGATTAKIVENISRFLRIPLHIHVGNERITHIPWSTSDSASLIATPCTSCGAPLSKIEASMKSIKCNHCGTNMIIQWQDDKLSYRAENELDI